MRDYGSLNVDIKDIDAILVTHEHIDHSKSLGNLSSNYNIPVYANQKTWDALKNEKDKIDSSNIKIFKTKENFEIGDLKILPFSTPHDAADSCGFNFFYDNKKLSIATDLGHINSNLMKNFEDSSSIMLESNYDPEILKFCSYPYMLKQRILGPNGHLPNNIAGETISKLINSGLKDVLFIHLSKENNFPELAYKTAIEELTKNNYNENSINISVAPRNNPSELFKVC